MSIRTHWDQCWRDPTHHACAMARIVQLEAQVHKLTACRETETAGCCTHKCFIPCDDVHDEPPGHDL